MNNHSPKKKTKKITPLINPRKQKIKKTLKISPKKKKITLNSNKFINNNYYL